MTAPSSVPSGERPGTSGARWETELRTVEQVVDGDAPDPKPNRATRRRVARTARRKR